MTAPDWDNNEGKYPMQTSMAALSTSPPYTQADLRALRVEVVWVTPQMAKALRSSCHFERQRKLQPENIKRLSHEMERGQFVRATPVFMGVLPDGSMVLLNGNHTLEAVVLSGISLPLTFIYHDVADMDAAGMIYATFDIHRVRQWGTSLAASGLGKDVPMSNAVLAALGYIMDGFGTSRDSFSQRSRPDRLHLIAKYKQPAALLMEAWEKAYAPNVAKLKRAGTLAVALETALAQPSAAVEFWGSVARDDELPTRDPRKALLRFISSNKAAGREERENLVRVAAAAWNAWWSHETRHNFQPQQMKGFRLLGTRWHKGTMEGVAPASVARPAERSAGSGRKPLFETAIKTTEAGPVQMAWMPEQRAAQRG